MRCKHLVERNGYYTGRQCSREASQMVTYSDGRREPHCMQHAKQEVARSAHWSHPISAGPIPIADVLEDCRTLPLTEGFNGCRQH